MYDIIKNSCFISADIYFYENYAETNKNYATINRLEYTISRFRNMSQDNIGQVSPLPILLIVHTAIQQPCKHHYSESINKN